MKLTLTVLAALLLAPLAALHAADPTELAPKPNILVILADDLGFSGLGCYGHKTHKLAASTNAKPQRVRGALRRVLDQSIDETYGQSCTPEPLAVIAYWDKLMCEPFGTRAGYLSPAAANATPNAAKAPVK